MIQFTGVVPVVGSRVYFHVGSLFDQDGKAKDSEPNATVEAVNEESGVVNLALDTGEHKTDVAFGFRSAGSWYWPYGA